MEEPFPYLFFPVFITEFTTSELVESLGPVLEKLFRQEPEGVPFRLPVDPERLQIPVSAISNRWYILIQPNKYVRHTIVFLQDYFDVVKNPMDLTSIRKNLETGVYREPWAFIGDVWLMFNNAWLYNRKTSKVYKYCSRLKEIFEQDIDPVMVKLGYCCGRKVCV